jgi:RimJ/RimL family protein N-acetyltransferase
MAELGGVKSDAETADYLERNLSHWDTHGFGVWMVCPRGGQNWIGRIVLRWLSAGTIDDVEIGFAFLPTYWGRGLATEAGEFCLGVAQSELEPRTVIGVTTPENLASQRVLRKLGLRYESKVVVEQTRCHLHRVRW